jgi:hypothetical protein
MLDEFHVYFRLRRLYFIVYSIMRTMNDSSISKDLQNKYSDGAFPYGALARRDERLRSNTDLAGGSKRADLHWLSRSIGGIDPFPRYVARNLNAFIRQTTCEQATLMLSQTKPLNEEDEERSCTSSARPVG